jgi:hypothetical protein
MLLLQRLDETSRREDRGAQGLAGQTRIHARGAQHGA